MKNSTITFLALFITLNCFAQNGINYKAVIKDNNGNVVANQTIDVKFSILQGATDVYREFHTQSTDANGIIILNIGEGTPSLGVFNDLDWASDNHFLKVEVDIERDGTFVFMGTTQFKTVPYALQAKSATFLTQNGVTSNIPGNLATDDFVFGSNQLDNDISTTDDDSRMFFNKAKSAFRAGLVDDDDQWDDSKLGLVSTAFGSNTEAIGDYSFAGGFGTKALVYNAFAIGDETLASGLVSTAMGINTRAESYASTAIGRYNVGGGNATVWQATDPLFEIGNGDNNALRTNAFTVFKNGIITAPSLDINEIIDDKALITKEYADANLTSSGLEQITENSNSGWRLKGVDPLNYADIGEGAVDISVSSQDTNNNGAIGDYSFAGGSNTNATGDYSTALGNYTAASGFGSFAAGSGSLASGQESAVLGKSSTASGNFSVALGVGNEAQGGYSVAMGNFSTAIGSRSSSLGYGTVSQSFASLAIGKYNIGFGNTSSSVDTDPLLEIGNGTSTTPSNALTVLKNGKVGIGTHTPGERLTVIASSQSEKAIYTEATGLYGRAVHAKVTSTHSSANAILAESGGGASYAGYFVGNVHVAGVLSKSSGSFKIDHPLDPENKYLSHSFVESPDMMNIYNGNTVTDKEGNAIVKLPEYFEALNMEFRYQLTVIGEFAQAIISKKIEANTFKIKTDKPNIEVSWQVTGVRNDAFARKNRIPVEEDKEVENVGTYLNPEAFSNNASSEKDKSLKNN